MAKGGRRSAPKPGRKLIMMTVSRALTERTRREIVLDTETTGLDPLSGHRIVEIGAVELVDHSPTGRTFHRYAARQPCRRRWRNGRGTGGMVEVTEAGA
jgi:DNA polymerase III epsilon subunit-like protein